MHNVAHDEEFITTTLAETIKVDEFTANLFNIYRKVLAHGFTQVRQTACVYSHIRTHTHTHTYSHHHA